MAESGFEGHNGGGGGGGRGRKKKFKKKKDISLDRYSTKKQEKWEGVVKAREWERIIKG